MGSFAKPSILTKRGAFLLPLVQIDAAGTRFRKWIDNWIAAKLTSFSRYGIVMLPKRCEKIVENDGKYFN